MRIALVVLTASLVTLYACGRGPDTGSDVVKVRWDEVPRAANWTAAALGALDTHGAALLRIVPRDVEDYCPGYAEAGERERKAFWINLVASLAMHESTWRPEVSGGGGQWHGLLQISPATARGYGCVASDAAELKVGRLNVACGIRIMAHTVARDGVISADMRGIAADWGPFHQERKRADMQNFTRQLPYCRK